MIAPHLIHADWSVDPRKRIAASARPKGDGRYEIVSLAPFGLAASALQSLESPVLLGFDFPIGVPKHYGDRLPYSSFLEFIAAFDEASWSSFARPAERSHEICLERPFYPFRPGGTSQRHLLEAHSALSINDLRRRCELKTDSCPAACSLFWTLGGNQVGKAALAGWAEVVRPLMADGAGLWPFHGKLFDLLSRRKLTIAETYPADAMRQIGLIIPRGWSKRRQSDRLRMSEALFSTARKLDVDLSASVATAVENGFGAEAIGEDRFDAFVGLLGMIAVVRGHRSEGSVDDAGVLVWEGWILGRQPCESSSHG